MAGIEVKNVNSPDEVRPFADKGHANVLQVGRHRPSPLPNDSRPCAYLQAVQPRRGPTPRERTGARHGYETHDEASRNSAIPLAAPHPWARTGARHGYATVTSPSRIRYTPSQRAGLSKAVTAARRRNA